MPFENPNQLTNFFELLAIIMIPAALTYTYGRLAGRPRARAGRSSPRCSAIYIASCSSP